MWRQDLAAGVLAAFVIIPSAFGYAHLAGLSPSTGLYALIASGLIFTALSTSRDSAVGPSSRVSMLVAAALASVVAGAPSGRVHAFAQVLSLMVGAMLLLAAVLRMGAMTRFFSRPVLIGYGLGSATVILSSEFSKLVGLEARGLNMRILLSDAWAHRADLHPLPVFFGLGCLATLLALKRFVPRFAFVLFLLAATLLIALTGLDERGVRVVGELRAANPGIPRLQLFPGELRSLLPGALALFTVVFLGATSNERSMARPHHYQIRPNRELVALGAMNIASGLGGGFVVSTNSGDGRLLEASRAQTPVAGLVVIVLAIATLAIGPTLRNMPHPALAAVVIVSVVEGVGWRAPARVWRFSRQEFFLTLAAFIGVVLVGLIPGLLIAAVLTILVLLWGASHPHTAQLGLDTRSNQFVDLATHPEGNEVPGVLIYRLDSQLFFANENFVVTEVLTLARDASHPTHAVILDLSAVNGIDLSGYEGLLRLKEELAANGMQLWGANAKGPLRKIFERQGHEGGISATFAREDLRSVVAQVRGASPHSAP